VTLTCEYQLAVEYQLEDFDGISETKLHHSYCRLGRGTGGERGVVGDEGLLDQGKGSQNRVKESKRRKWNKKECKERLLG
jgi:hypothetical protein